MPAARLITTLAIFMRLQVASSSFSVTILRHAETEWNVRGMLQGSKDSGLTERGLEQARLCGQRLRKQVFTTCYTSPLPRAKLTAELVLRRMDMPPPIEVDERLRERAFGDWEGMVWKDIEEQFPDDVVKSRNDADFKISGGGESRNECLARSLEFLSELPKMHSPDERVLIVTHSATAVCLVKEVLGLPQGSRRSFNLINLAINEMQYNYDQPEGQRWMLQTLGDTAHLEIEEYVPGADFQAQTVLEQDTWRWS